MNDSKKLKMILDHQREYYIPSREYLFFEEGFLCYELTKVSQSNCIYFHDFYITPEARGSSLWRNMFKEAMKLKDQHNLDLAFCSLQKKDNPFLDKLKHIYASWGFSIWNQNDEEINYIKDLRYE